eukprot:gene15979-7310_t
MAGAELENCAFRAKQLIQANDRNLVDGRASFKAVDEISDLPFTVAFSSPYICKYCVTILKKRHSFRLKLKDIDKVLKNRYNSVSLLQVKSNTLEEPAVKIRLVGSSFCSTPLSKKHAFTQTNKCNFILKSSNKNQENLPFQQKANALNYPKAAIARLRVVKLTVSHPCLHKKLDEFVDLLHLITAHSDSVLINRRNVGSDVRSRYAAFKQFFLMEVECRIIAATMEILQLQSLDGVPQENHLLI